jgi:hypothetical protein
MMTQDFVKDFDYLIDRIFVKKQHTIFSRYADGELALMLGREIGTFTQAYQIDKWKSPGIKTELGKELEDTLKNNSKDKFYAISCGCCDASGRDILLQKLKDNNIDIGNITFSNLWINGNYKRVKKIIENIKEDVILIANKEGLNKIYPFEVSQYLPIEDDCVNFWNDSKEELVKNLENMSAKPKLYLISAGPLSEVIIELLVKMDVNKLGRYIDIGSALDEFTKGYKTRPYMDENQIYYNQVCNF